MNLSLRLMLLCAVAVLPAAGVQIWDELAQRRQRMEEIHAEARRAASYAASEIDRVVDGARQLLTALAVAPQVAARDRAACSGYVAELERRFPEYGRISVADAEGRIICADADIPGQFSVADLGYFQQAARSGEFVVGEFLTGRIRGRPLLPFAQPIIGPDGTVDRVAIGAISLDWLSAELEERGLPPGGSVTVADRTGTIVARAPLPERFVGTRIPDRFLPLLRAPAIGTQELTSQDGTRRVLGYVPVDFGPQGLYVSAGLSTEAAFAQIEHATRVAFALIAAGLLSAVLAALVAGRLFLGPPVRRLLGAMARWRDGDTGARVGALSGGSELARLGAGFDAMADALEARTAELRGSEEWLRLAQEAGGVGAWAWDPASGIAKWSPGLYRLLGLDPQRDGRPTGARFTELVHPEDRAAYAAAMQAAAEGRPLDAEFRILRPGPDGRAEVRWLASRGGAQAGPGLRQGWVLGVNVDVTVRREAEERLLLLAREVDHRAKNALAVVQAAVRLAPRDDPAAFVRAVEGRVAALARAQVLLSDARWEGASLRAVAEGALAPFLPAAAEMATAKAPAAAPDRAAHADLRGPALTLAAEAVQPFTLALHELATNASKYGALSSPEGRVAVTWSVDRAEAALRLRWEETGGPAIADAPHRRGFGTRVLQATIRDQLGGTVERSWPGTGLVCELTVPLRRATGRLHVPEVA